ncbi:unnamed protein product [Peronospora farinosa]|uniref:BHLH domain-containing protein n=1 Tax=Peronospora farinosa TaxID=134698 RepID=A0ABN8BYQ8_9STRA|nr:unnamed protein product [Peronospora farinosa]
MHTTVKYEQGVPYYSPPTPRMSSSNYRPTLTSNCSDSSTPSNAVKRSREDLNQKEKQRMFKLNERISQLKALLDDAGVQTKKNKQSVLDNTSQYIEMLRGDLEIAQQKAEQAQKETKMFLAQENGGKQTVGNKVMSGVFQKTTTPRVVLDIDMKTVVFNTAFVKLTGLSELVLKKKKIFATVFVCGPNQVPVHHKESSRDETVDSENNVTNVELSLIPMEMQQQQRPSATKRQKIRAAHNGTIGSVPKSDTANDLKR